MEIGRTQSAARRCALGRGLFQNLHLNRLSITRFTQQHVVTVEALAVSWSYEVWDDHLGQSVRRGMLTRAGRSSLSDVRCKFKSAGVGDFTGTLTPRSTDAPCSAQALASASVPCAPVGAGLRQGAGGAKRRVGRPASSFGAAARASEALVRGLLVRDQ